MNRGLTKAEAEAGVVPVKLTRDEWRAMHDAALLAYWDAIQATANKAWEARERRLREADA